MTQTEVSGKIKRQLLELALEAGKRHLSPQTGMVHYCYEDDTSRDTIPLYENLCYCLTLFRTLSQNNVQEAKERLKAVLSFRLENGHFPIYLHQYPHLLWSPKCFDPLQLILSHFGKVIEPSLRCELEKLPPRPAEVKEIRSSADCARAALTLQEKGEGLDLLASYWDPHLQLYRGPLIDEWQRGFQPEVTLFDLFMAHVTGHLSPRLLEPHPVHLQAALVFPQQEIKAFAAPTFTTPMNNSKGFHHFRKVWEDEGILHTFVCQERGVTMEGGAFIYPESLPEDKQREELNFYTNRHSIKTVLINGEKGTVFRLGDLITIKTKTQALKLTLTLEEGEGDVLGHISFGNRPSQRIQEIDQAFDWKFTVRTLRRTPKFKLALALVVE